MDIMKSLMIPQGLLNAITFFIIVYIFRDFSRLLNAIGYFVAVTNISNYPSNCNMPFMLSSL